MISDDEIRKATLYAAAHAPEEIPYWFNHVPPKGRPKRKGTEDYHGTYEERLRQCEAERDAIDAEIKQWQDQNAAARYFQWRTFYAKTMVEDVVVPLWTKLT